MSVNGAVTIAWADGDHVFNVAKVAQVLELEEKCDAGCAEIFDRLRSGRWRFNDVRETIRLGLIGGGMTPPKALVLVKRYVDERPWQESVPVALAILMSAMVGVPGDTPGKAAADRAATEADGSTNGAALSDPQSMASAPASAGTRDRQTKRRSGSSPPASTDTTEPTAPSPSQT